MKNPIHAIGALMAAALGTNVPGNPDRAAVGRPGSSMPPDERQKRTIKRNLAKAARRKNRKAK